MQISHDEVPFKNNGIKNDYFIPSPIMQEFIKMRYSNIVKIKLNILIDDSFHSLVYI